MTTRSLIPVLLPHGVFHVKATSLFGAFALLASPALAGMPAYAQESGRLAPTGGAAEGIISWNCAGMPRVDLSGYRQDGRVTYVTWQFDQDQPETVYLRSGFSPGEWVWGNQEAARFISRAKSASRLVIRMLGNPPSAQGTVYTYDLGRSRGLRGAGCVDGSTVPPALDWPPPEGLSYESPSDSAGDVTYELSAVEQHPEMLRAREFGRDIARNYPPGLQDAGVTGTVLVRFRVLKDGRVDLPSIKIISSPDPLFDAPVLRYLPLLHFRPARVKGRPVKVWVELPVQFALPA